MTPVVDTSARNRNRWMLVALFALFFGGMAIAGLLRFSGWRPEGLKNKGELLQPPIDLRDVDIALADGGTYRWKEAPRTWRIAAMTHDCDTTNAVACERLLADLDKVWQLAGKDADRVHVLWIGTLPAKGPHPATLRVIRPTDALRDGLPRSQDPRGMPVYLLDPNGFVVLRYAPGSDPGDLRTDLSRLLKVN
jgi:cytochrome oxidase Cu insertion factor (SCO1/SenC/PrrC family)